MTMIDTLRSVLRFRKIEWDATSRRLASAASVADLRRIARRRLPRGVFDYIDGGAEDERALANNTDAFARLEFRPRVLRSVGHVDPSTTLLGRPLPFPLVLAPTGFTRVADPQGELAVGTGRRAGRAPVHAVDAGHPVDRGGRRRQRRSPVVPGLRVARPGPGQGDDRSLRRVRATRRWCSRSTPPCSVGASATCAGGSRCRRRSVSARCSTAPCTLAGRGRSCAPSRSCSPTSSAGRRRTGRRDRPRVLVRVRQQPVRPGPVVGRRRVAALDVGRPDRDQGHPVGGRCRARRRARRRGHRPVQPRRPTARLGPGADRPRGAGGRGGRRPASRSSATAACGGAATSSRRWPSVRRRAWPGGPTCTGSARPASAASTTCSGCSQADVRRTMALVGAGTIADLTPDLVSRR